MYHIITFCWEKLQVNEFHSKLVLPNPNWAPFLPTIECCFSEEKEFIAKRRKHLHSQFFFFLLPNLVPILYTNTVGLLKMSSLDITASFLYPFPSSTLSFLTYTPNKNIWLLIICLFVCFIKHHEMNTPIINSQFFPHSTVVLFSTTKISTMLIFITIVHKTHSDT